MYGTHEWQDVADALNARLLQIGLTQRALSERSRVSLTTLRELQRGAEHRQRSARTLAAISEALGWQPDHLQRIAEGRIGQVLPPAVESLRDQETLTELHHIRQHLTELNHRVDRLLRRYLESQPR